MNLPLFRCSLRRRRDCRDVRCTSGFPSLQVELRSQEECSQVCRSWFGGALSAVTRRGSLQRSSAFRHVSLRCGPISCSDGSISSGAQSTLVSWTNRTLYLLTSLLFWNLLCPTHFFAQFLSPVVLHLSNYILRGGFYPLTVTFFPKTLRAQNWIKLLSFELF